MSGPDAAGTSLLPGTGANGQQTTLGVMGGGQLGRMFVQAAQRMGYFTAVLDPDVASPAGLLSHYHIRSDYTDQQGLAQLISRCAAITTEFENVPAPALLTLGAQRPVAPTADAVAVAQDRAHEKRHFARCGVRVAAWALIDAGAQLDAAAGDLFPGILKTCRLGYDGKGQVRVADRAALAPAWAELGGVPCVLEQQLALAAECSVIVARGADGACVNYPVQRNLHRNGILALTSVYDGNVSPELAAQAIAATKSIADELQYVGVLCVEFFVLEDGSLVVNEMAPRPHNSGHYSIDACDVSQFELQVRTLAGLPLTQPRQHSAALMLNLLGDLWTPGAPDFAKVLALPGAHLHLYGKLEARPGRKMGHLTLTAASVSELLANAKVAAKVLGVAPF